MIWFIDFKSKNSIKKGTKCKQRLSKQKCQSTDLGGLFLHNSNYICWENYVLQWAGKNALRYKTTAPIITYNIGIINNTAGCVSVSIYKSSFISYNIPLKTSAKVGGRKSSEEKRNIIILYY